MDRRRVLAVAAAFGGLQLAGCSTTSDRRAPADRHCYWSHTPAGSRPICTPVPVPDAAADAQAKRFLPVPGRLVVYVVRHRWGDAQNLVNLGIDGAAAVVTVPASLVRLEVPPGVHRLAFDWKRGKGDLEIRGDAGEVLFVDLAGSLWIWNEWYRLEMGEPSIRDRALKCRLVADVKLGE